MVVPSEGSHKSRHSRRSVPMSRSQSALACGLWGGVLQHLESQVVYTLVELRGEDAIPVMEEEAIAMVSWDRFAQLLQRPCSRGVRGHIDMQDAAGGMFHHDKDIEQAKGGRDHHTEITGDDRLGMVAHKRHPALGRHPFAWSRGLALRHIFAYRAR